MTMDAVIERAKRQSARLGHNYVGTEHALLAIVDDEPALLEPYGVTRQKLVQVLTVELLRIIGELRDAQRIVEPVRQAAEQHSGTELAPKAFSGVTVRLTAILDDARSPSDHDVLAAMLDEDSNLAVIVLDRLGVPLDELRRRLD
jgi:ATP-dependent Clp protease ATP-binding subunit ClpA